MKVAKNRTKPFKLKETFRTAMLLIVVFATFSCNTDDGPNEPTIIEVSTLAGSTAGYADGTGSEAKFDYLTGATVDVSGNLYVADLHNNKIRKVTPEGIVTTIAGGISIGDFKTVINRPIDVALDASGNVYVANSGNHKVLKITPTGSISVFAGSTVGYANGIGKHAKFDRINGIAVDNAGNVYVTDMGNRKVRKITPEGIVTTLAGTVAGFADGLGISAQFNLLRGIAVDASGNVYVADDTNDKIRKITPTGDVSTLAGSNPEGDVDGPGDTAEFNNPTDVAVDDSGNVYVTDWNNHKIRKITPSGNVSTLAGTGEKGYADGFGDKAMFNYPYGLTVDASNTVYVAGPSNAKIRKITQK